MTFEPAPDGADPYLWLEDVTGAEALDWVRARNKPTTAAFCDAEFERMRVEALEVLDTDARIPYVNRRGNYLYNFWRDAARRRSRQRTDRIQIGAEFRVPMADAGRLTGIHERWT